MTRTYVFAGIDLLQSGLFHLVREEGLDLFGGGLDVDFVVLHLKQVARQPRFSGGTQIGALTVCIIPRQHFR